MTGRDPFPQLRCTWWLLLPVTSGSEGKGEPASADLLFYERSLLCSVRLLIPLWDLAVVKGPPFEPLKFVSLKTVLLLALALAERVGDTYVLSVRLSCSQFFSGT